LKNEGLAEKALKILQKRSEITLELAKKEILKEELECKSARDAFRYYVSKWKDTTRPGVFSMACEVVGGNLEESLPLQVSLSLIDAGLDIHDDIIDNSVSKNTESTVYGKFGKDTALLLGIAFLVKGFDNLCKAVENLPQKRKTAITEAANNFLFEEIDAHIMEAELKSRKWDTKPNEYLHVLEKKAVDIEGRMRIGAIFGSGSSKEITAIGNYGRKLGILLAVRSDFIDIFEPSELANRVRNECLPLPVLYSLQSSVHVKKVQRILLKELIDESDVNELVETIYHTAGLRHLRQYLNDLREKAIMELDLFPRNEAKDELLLLISSMTEDL